jgi:protein-S-isoprenylcysteine O-methyltransferase Ste14
MNTDTSPNQLNGKPDTTGGMRLKLKVLLRVVIFTLIMAAIWYIASGHLDWVMGWAFIGAYMIIAAVAALIVPLDPELTEERTQIKEDVKVWDKWIVIILNIWTPLGLLILAGLDIRFGWSPVIPLALQIAMLVLAVLGYLVSVWAAASNKFYGRFVRIQKERGHTVATGGPYQYVRHPGYAGLIIFYFAVALALGSLWTLILNGLASLLLVVRTALEDKTLLKELDGYREYAGRVRYRLLPGIW